MVDKPEEGSPPTFQEVQRALAENVNAILDQIPVKTIQLSLPLDGAGARIMASVEAGEGRRVPGRVRVVLSGRGIVIPVEAKENYEPTKAQ
jgi:hypothetical protein